MKYLIVRCEDHAAGPSESPSPLLEGAKLVHLRNLAQAGAAGTLRLKHRSVLTERFPTHQALLGLGAAGAGTAAGRCAAARLGIRLSDDETAWCVTLVTQHDGRVADPAAGGIPTKEGRELLAALNEQLGAETRRWVGGEGEQHLLIVRDPALRPDEASAIPGPEALVGRAWGRSLPRGPLGSALRRLIEQASQILEAHPVNRVRSDLGENPANGVWIWGASTGDARPPEGMPWTSGAVVSDAFLVQGLARAIGWVDSPIGHSLTASTVKRLCAKILEHVEAHQVVYVHLAVSARTPVERQVAMERIDTLLLQPCSSGLSAAGPSRMLVIVDDCASGDGLVVATGHGLPHQAVASLKSDAFAQSPLRFTDAGSLSAWLRQDT